MVKGEDDNDVFHNVARADSVIEEKDEEEEGEDRDSCKIKIDDRGSLQIGGLVVKFLQMIRLVEEQLQEVLKQNKSPWDLLDIGGIFVGF